LAEKVCPVLESKFQTAKELIDTAVTEIKNKNKKKMNLVWIEAAGCSGNIISLLNGNAPDVTYFLTDMVDLKYNNSIMVAQGEQAQEQLQQALNTEFILIVDGAISTKDNGIYNIVSYYNGKPITGMEEVKRAADKAKYILTVGTCASLGDFSAKPNPSNVLVLVNFAERGYKTARMSVSSGLGYGNYSTFNIVWKAGT
jgi:hydrogenase small subunit